MDWNRPDLKKCSKRLHITAHLAHTGFYISLNAIASSLNTDRSNQRFPAAFVTVWNEVTVSFAAVVVVVTVTVLGTVVSMGTMVMPPPDPDELSEAGLLASVLRDCGADCDEEPDAMTGSDSEEGEAGCEEGAGDDESSAVLVIVDDLCIVVVPLDWVLDDGAMLADPALLGELVPAPEERAALDETVSLAEVDADAAEVCEIWDAGTVVGKVKVYSVTVVAARRGGVEEAVLVLIDVSTDKMKDDTSSVVDLNEGTSVDELALVAMDWLDDDGIAVSEDDDDEPGVIMAGSVRVEEVSDELAATPVDKRVVVGALFAGLLEPVSLQDGSTDALDGLELPAARVKLREKEVVTDATTVPFP
ncbi:MAG: hypothetical protein M1822_004265 [Bathelium mastoideum]|nr:MAG: hypothetical protein M1822_004265 [Bathelium mastoideum]